jgi:hypothetical protein
LKTCLHLRKSEVKKLLIGLFVDYVALKVVALRFRMLAFRGACGEPPWRFAPSGVSPVPLIPQESRTLHSNQLVNEEMKKEPKATIF